ncbi:hypothetical protein ACHAWC_003438 [Mediolabrus comicus]
MTTIEPTYRLEPEVKLSLTKAKLIAETILAEKLAGASNKDDIEFEFEVLSKSLADTVKEKIKSELNVPRYKILVQSTLGTMKDQGVKITSRCLWDVSTDNYVSASFQNEFVFASVLVFFLYTA